jgi:hypothetical protein
MQIENIHDNYFLIYLFKFNFNLNKSYNQKMTEEIIKIKELDLEIIQPNTSTFNNPEQGGSKIVIIGKPNTGKSHVIASILYNKRHIYPVAMAMSETEDTNSFYRKIMPSTFVFNKYDEGQIANFIKRQKLAKQHLDNPWGILILDDCTDDPSVFRKPLQSGLYKYGRHWKCLYLLCLQYAMDIKPAIRTNVDGVFIMREPNLRNRNVIYENYASIIPSRELFYKIMDEITNDYTALYIHNSTNVNTWQECVFWYKAKKVPDDFKFGCDEYWRFHEERYNPEYVDNVETIITDFKK